MTNKKDRVVASKKVLIVALTLSLGVSGVALARSFRSIAPIASPDAKMLLPEGAVAVTNPTPVPRKLVETKLERIISRWNSATMQQTLADEFYDKSRLLDAVESAVPRDAVLRLQSLQSVRTVQQYRTAGTDSSPGKKTSIVSATARTQLEFNTPTGFVRLPGTNEFILRITELEKN